MAFNTKLDVHKLILDCEKGNPTFLKRFTTRIDQEDSAAFMDIVGQFFKVIDLNDFHASKKRSKAITMYDTQKTDLKDPSIMPYPHEEILCGYLEGGKFGKKRVKSALGEKQSKETLDDKTVILDRYFFLLYLPLDSKIGIAIVQSYTSETVTDIFIDLLKDFFTDKNRKYSCKSERFFPKSIADQFNKDSNIKTFSYTTRMLLGQLDDSPLNEKKKEFTIKIEATAKDRISQSDYKKWLKKIGESLFTISKTPKTLSDFENGKIVLENKKTKKPATFEIQRDFTIKPTIYLDEEKIKFVDGVPETTSLKNYCKELLEDIKKEVYPRANKVN